MITFKRNTLYEVELYGREFTLKNYFKALKEMVGNDVQKLDNPKNFHQEKYCMIIRFSRNWKHLVDLPEIGSEWSVK